MAPSFGVHRHNSHVRAYTVTQSFDPPNCETQSLDVKRKQTECLISLD